MNEAYEDSGVIGIDPESFDHKELKAAHGFDKEPEIEQVMTQEVFEEIEKQKRVKGLSMKKLCRVRGQEFIDAQKDQTVKMSDRTYEVSPTGWKSSKKSKYLTN
jgi:hypothetical protein